jgi:hypothetical protein
VLLYLNFLVLSKTEKGSYGKKTFDWRWRGGYQRPSSWEKIVRRFSENPKRIVNLMNMNMHASWVKGAALASLVAASASAQVVVYDNSTTPLNAFFSTQREVGDEITIGPGWTAHSFTFEYFAENLSGNEKGRVRFYRNDGIQVEGTSSAAPGALLFESTQFDLINGNYPVSIVDLVGLNIQLPNSFTWTVKVDGLTDGETFSLKLYDPPTVGSSFNDFWHFTTEGWELQQVEGLPPGAGSSFGATLIAVPEPGTMTVLGVGALALLARRRVARG